MAKMMSAFIDDFKDMDITMPATSQCRGIFIHPGSYRFEKPTLVPFIA